MKYKKNIEFKIDLFYTASRSDTQVGNIRYSKRKKDRTFLRRPQSRADH